MPRCDGSVTRIVTEGSHLRHGVLSHPRAAVRGRPRLGPAPPRLAWPRHTPPPPDRFRVYFALQEGGSERGEADDGCAGGESRQDRIRFQVTLEEGEGDEEREEDDEAAGGCDDDVDLAGDAGGEPSGDPTSAAGM